jgi:tripartite-type tricarboxylate transporter receptor subunit TctC
MSALVKKAIESKEWADFTASIGTTPEYQDPAAFTEFVGEMDTVTKTIMKDAGLAK